MSAELVRRAFITALGAVPLAGSAVAAEPSGAARPRDAKTRVAYFSRSGNTQVVAGLLQRALNADLFRIEPATPYPEDYLETVEMAQRERDSGRERPLAARMSTMARVETLYLGFPIWGQTAPPIIRAFLSAHDLSGRTVIPFITHGGYGLGDSLAVLARLAPKAQIREGFVMEADQERRTMERVNDWMKRANVR